MKKTVMHILNTKDFSGAENVAITIIRIMKDEMDGIYVSLDGPIREYLDEQRIRYYPVNKLSVQTLRKAIFDINPDIIHAHDFTAGIISVLTGVHIPIVNHIHNNSPWIKHYNIRSSIYALSCYKYKKILTVSESVMNEYVFGHRFKYKTEVVGNPIDIIKIRKLAGSTATKYDVAFLGRLSPQKNPYLFLEIIGELRKRLPGISVIMIGDGELRTDVEKKIIDAGLKDNITLVGFQKNPYIYLNQAKILCMPSSWEGYGLAAVEALALGKPVVCSNAGGLPNIVNESCGVVCEKKEEYRDAIWGLLVDNVYNQKSKNATKQSYKIADLEGYSKRLFRIYSEILQ